MRGVSISVAIVLACRVAAADPDAAAPSASATTPAPTTLERVEAGLHVAPVDSVDIPFDRSELSVTLRGTAPGTFDGAHYQDGSLALGGAITLWSRLHTSRESLHAFRVLAQFRVEGERVNADMLAQDQKVTKAALGVTAAYLSPAMNLYAVYAGAAIAETGDTISSPHWMPTVIGLGSFHSSSSLIWIYGGGFGYALGRAWLLPAVGLAWRPMRGCSVTTILPVFADAGCFVAPRVRADVILSVSGDLFHFANDGAYPGANDQLALRLGQGRLGLGVTYRWNRNWSWRVELGAVGPRRLSINDGNMTLYSSDATAVGYVSTKVTYAFGSSPL